MKKLIVCPCGVTVRGKNDDELVANAQKHANEVHDGMKLEREQALSMAQPDPD